MLTGLKKLINEHREGNFPSDAILESASSVKDAFLDDPEVALIGAENDPEIAALINDIPGYDDGVDDAEMKKNVEALSESMTETVLETHFNSPEKRKHDIEYLEKEIAHQQKLANTIKESEGETAWHKEYIDRIERYKEQIQTIRDSTKPITARR
jgi:hypothetical protein